MEHNWEQFYKRWISRINEISNKEVLLNKVLNKYGNKQNVGDVLIFSVIYEYAKCYGKLIENESIFEDLLEDAYSYEGHTISLMFSEPAYIIIH
jgi:hypothetical protein